MLEIREIKPGDNVELSAVIKDVLIEFGADPKTTMLGDPSLYKMYEYYQFDKAVFFVALMDGKIVGGCGIKKLDGSADEDKICELQRMYLLPEARGLGIGKKLMEICQEKAKEFGYTKIYIESLPQMQSAISLYKKSGFEFIDQPLGNTGHGGCDVWMLRHT
jgi:putative acetyltransferase